MGWNDTFLSYVVQQNGVEACCALRFIRVSHCDVVIASELSTNPGISVTHACCEIAAQVALKLNLDTSRLLFFEHYGPFSYFPSPFVKARQEQFARVQFSYSPHIPDPLAPGLGTFSDPRWEAVSKEDIENLVGVDLPPFQLP